MPAMIHFQRQANRWLQRLREVVARDSLFHGTHPSSYDYFDVLRGTLNIANGALLEEAHCRPNSPSIATSHDGAWSKVWRDLKLFAYLRRRNWQRRRLNVTTQERCEDGPILAVPRHGGHLTEIVPVLSSLRECDGLSVACAALTRNLAKQAADHALPVLQVYGRRPLSNIPRRRRLNDFMSGLQRAVDSVVAAGTPEFAPEMTVRLAANTKAALQANLEDAVETADAIESMLHSAQPRMVIIGNPYTFEGRLTALAARRFGIPTLVIEHGSIFPDDPIWEDCPVDLICAWGEPSRRALLSCGVEEKKIVVTGAPGYDAVFAQAGDDSLRRAPNRAYVLVATSGPGDQVSLPQHLGFIRALYEAVDRNPDISWLVKLHKKDRLEYYAGENGGPRANLQLVNGGTATSETDIFDFLRPARFLLTISSTAALDAMAVHVPVVTYDVWTPGAGLSGVEFLENGSTYRAHTPRQLADLMRRLWDGWRDQAIDASALAYSKWHFANRGAAADAVCKQIRKLLNRPTEGANAHG